MSTDTTRAALLREFNTLPDCAYVRRDMVAAVYGVSYATFHRYVKAGDIPPATLRGLWQVGAVRRHWARPPA